MAETIQHPVCVVGAGPVGLAAAAHLALRNLPFVVLEAGDGPAAAMAEWGHVTIFSPWRFNVDSAARLLLAQIGWSLPETDLDRDPTGRELIDRYLAPLAAHPRIAPNVQYGSRVSGISREGIDLVPDKDRFERPFEVTFEQSGREMRLVARAIIDASGTWRSPNPAGANGRVAAGEREAAARIAYGIPDVTGAARSRYAGRRVLVIGSGHSAMDVMLDLARLRREEPATSLLWAMRSLPDDKSFGGGSDDQLASRGELGTRAKRLVESGAVELVAPFRTRRFAISDLSVEVTGSAAGEDRHLTVDEVIVATGFRPDRSPLTELRLDLDPTVEAPRALAPLIDPNLHSCGDVPPHGHRELAHPERDFYIVGMKSYGRAPTFLMATGYEQARSVVAALAGDLEAADRVELVLPKTGVCEGLGHAVEDAGDCCGGAPVDSASACCRADELSKNATGKGCGCSGAPRPAAEARDPAAACC